MKIIDLLNKITNSEEIPKYIKYYDRLHQKEDTMMCCYDNIIYKLDNNIIDLLDEVEIIEEDKEIEKIDIMSDEATPNSYYILNEHGTKCYLTKHSKVIADRVNLLIDKVNNMENKQ